LLLFTWQINDDTDVVVVVVVDGDDDDYDELFTGSIQWPAGTYGIPKPISGCPKAYGFRWLTGWRLQRDDFHYLHEGSESNNSRSLEFHIDGRVDNFKVNRSFCMKEDPSKDVKYKRPTWPRGSSCAMVSYLACFQRRS